jgi:hypothetical protein
MKLLMLGKAIVSLFGSIHVYIGNDFMNNKKKSKKKSEKLNH